jgi:cobalt ECF transporter T component CbiQ
VTPQWLLQQEAGLCPCGCIGARRRGSYLDKTVRAATGTLRAVLLNDDLARARGPLQRVDPRAKLVALLMLLVSAALVHSLPLLAAAYALTLAGAAAARLPLGLFIKRVWLFVPLFTGIVVLPATLSIVTPGEIVVPLFGDVGLTRQGLTGAGLITLRVAVSISLVLLVTLTTRWTDLLAALRVPRAFVLVAGMSYRYLLVLLDVVTDLHEARRARTLKPRERSKTGRQFVAGGAGVLLGRTHDLAVEVHQAMVARGFRGEVRALDAPRLTARDVAVLAAAAVLSIVLIGAPRAGL